MTDSAPSNIVTGTSGNPAPAPPALAAPSFDGVVATLVVTMPTVDVNNNPLPGPLTAIKVFFAPAGTLAGNAGVAPVVIPGSFAPGSQESVAVTVPDYLTAYDFDAEVSI